MGRIEHIDNPNAPRANSIVVAATAFVLDKDHRVLLIRRTDNGLWALPGGAQDFGETVASAAERETLEETGISVRVTAIVGVYSSPHHVVEYSDGEVRQQFSLCFRADPVGGTLTTSDESSEVRWVSESNLDDLDINPSMRLRIEHGFANRAPYIG
ncbi:NUDIX hydrolase [Stackebrandtia soli]|uniref:NUDIX hydrolase n=1 Tax=Stackebrandtia soli TaxID=1892856 RepID=UPI0039E85C7B